MSTESVPYHPEGPIKVIPYVLNVYSQGLDLNDDAGIPTAGVHAQRLQDTYNSIVSNGGIVERVHEAAIYGTDHAKALFFVVRTAQPSISDFDTPAPAVGEPDTDYSI